MINDDDRDYDGIPDKFDSTFNTPEEVMRMKGIISKPYYMTVNEEELKKLINSGIPFISVNDNDKYKIIVDQSNSENARNTINQHETKVRKSR